MAISEQSPSMSTSIISFGQSIVNISGAPIVTDPLSVLTGRIGLKLASEASAGTTNSGWVVPG